MHPGHKLYNEGLGGVEHSIINNNNNILLKNFFFLPKKML